MKRVFIVVEGATEERFVRSILYPHFILLGIHLEAQLWVTNRKLGTEGGGNNFDLIENHIRRLMGRYEHDQNTFISTMIDLYAFPRQGNSVYQDEVSRIEDGNGKANTLEDKMAERFNYRNFIPYVQLHEFEALLLTDPSSFELFYTDDLQAVRSLCQEIGTRGPETINDTPEGAPSKRIIKHLPLYKKQKTTAGITVASHIGLHKMRERCPHFNQWLLKMEAI